MCILSKVESLIGEVDNLAARQGEEEVRYQSLLNQITSLQDQLSKRQKFDTLSSINDGTHQELINSEIKNEQLLSQLQARDQEILNEKKELEKFANQVMILEREKEELRSELAALQRESIEQQEARLQLVSSRTDSAKHMNLVETVRHKNNHISQLLADIDSIEKEHSVLKLKVSRLKIEIADKNEKVIVNSEENRKFKRTIEELRELCEGLKEQNNGFKNQLVEMVTDKEQRDERLDQLGVALDARLAQWQELLVQKDTELIELKQQLSLVTSSYPNSYVDSTRNYVTKMSQDLKRREEEINELKQEIAHLIENLNKSNEFVDHLKEQLKSKSVKLGDSPRLTKMKYELAEAHNRLKAFEFKVIDAEKDAEAKAEEMTEMVIQLREYETGVFGLSEAMDQIKELQKQKRIRDKHIEQLIQAGNQLQADANMLEEENLVLREKLGLDVDEMVRVDGVLAKYKADQTKLSEISQQLEAANNTQLTLKVQNRKYHKVIVKLKTQLRNNGYIPEVVSSEDDSHKDPPGFIHDVNEETKSMLIKEAEVLEGKLQDVIDENEALRKGMHEILDSVRNHDGSSAVQIESACLERLLEALDSRHVSGWYHPAMRLQAQLNMAEGNNAAFRDQLRILRSNEKETAAKLQNALTQVDLLQIELEKVITASHPLEEEHSSQESQPRLPAKGQFIDALKSKKKSLIQIGKKDEFNTTELEQKISHLSNKLSETEIAVVEKKELFESEKESWQNVRKSLESEIETQNEKVALLKAEVKEYSCYWKMLQEDPDSFKSSLASATLRLASLSSEYEKLKMKCRVLQELDVQTRSDKNLIQEELASLKSSYFQEILELRCEKDKLKTDLAILQDIHSECYPSSNLDEARIQVNHLTLKYREILIEKNNMEEVNRRLVNHLRQQVEVLNESSGKIFNIMSNQTYDQKQSLISHYQKGEFVQEIKNYTEKMYLLVKDQLRESEEHCKELESSLAAMVQQNLSQQLIEAELRNQLVDSVPYSQLVDTNKQLTLQQALIAELKSTVSKLQANIDSAEERAKAVEDLRYCLNYQHDKLQRQVLELTASSEDKMTIGRLTRELLRSQENEMASSQKLADLKGNLISLEKVCAEKENTQQYLEKQFVSEKKEMKKKQRWLAQTVSELHQRYLGHLPLLSVERFQAMLSRLHCDKTLALTIVSAALHPDTLLQTIKDKYLDTDGSAALKLQELKLKLNVLSLESKLNLTEEQLQRSENLSCILQEELLNQEKCWEKKQIMWENNLLEMTSSENQNDQSKSDDHAALNGQGGIKDSSDKVDLLSRSLAKDLEERGMMTSPTPVSDSSTFFESEKIKALNCQLNQVTMIMNEQSRKLSMSETEVIDLKSKVDLLKKNLDETKNSLEERENKLLKLQALITDKDDVIIDTESTEIRALKTTVASLQNIVNQKEETIGRYQTLLQQCRDEHSTTVANLQQELSTLQHNLDKKGCPSNKDNMEDCSSDKSSSAMKVILKRYLARVHQLEDELNESREQTTRLAVELGSSQQQTDKWTHTAEERLKTIQEMKQRIDSARSKEDQTDSNSELMEKSSEIEELNKTICSLKAKLECKEFNGAIKERLRGEIERSNKKLEVFQNQNLELKDEIQRLRKQLTFRQTSTPKSEAVSTAREEVLQKKVKALEQQISDYQEIIERSKEIHKSKCDQEFEKWEERKRWQTTNENLKKQLREKSNKTDVLRANVDRLKDTIMRLEKEKITLEGKFKNMKGLAVSQNLVHELQQDREKLIEEIKAVRMKSNLDSPMENMIESQERKLVTLKLSQKGKTALAEEIERLLDMQSRLQQANLRLEAQNLELKMQLEKTRLSELTTHDALDNSETEVVGSSQQVKGKARHRGDLERAIVVLKRVVEKLQAENKKLHEDRLRDVYDKGYIEKLQVELHSCQENYLDAVDKTSTLEEELKQCKEKLSLFEHDDLVAELSMTKSQLSQKCQLLNKVKVLLENAVIREKALKEQIRDLEKLVPPERLRGTYHERKY